MRTNTIELPEKFSQQLSQMPETGRFLHKVKVTLQSGEVLLNRKVFNSTVLHLEEDEEFTPEEIMHVELVVPSHTASGFSF